MNVAERIRRVTGAANLGRLDRPLRVTFSIGVSTARASTVLPIRLYASADSALYRAKTDGRNRVRQAADVSEGLDAGETIEPEALDPAQGAVK